MKKLTSVVGPAIRRALKEASVEMQAAEETTPTINDLSDDTRPERFVDLVVMVVSHATYRAHTTVTGEDADKIKFTTHGLKLIRRHLDALALGLARHVYPLADRPDGGMLKSLVHLAQSGGPPEVLVERWTKLFETLLPWMHSRTAVTKSIFTGRSYRAAQRLMAAVEEENLPARLNQLAGIPSASALVTHRKWIEEAAERAGAPLSTMESIMTDTESVGAAADEIRHVQTAIQSTDPMSDAATVLQAKKQKLTRAVEQISGESRAPSVVMSAATTALSMQPDSAVARKFRLTDEQTRVMQAKGKVVVAAGAGSGKTSTLVATIAHLVDEQGYVPSQIMACSFTRAASAELEEKIESQAKVHGVVVGTTHRMARDVISRHRPDLVTAMRNTKGADRCFKIAMKQVTMDMEGYKAQLEAGKEVLRRIEAVGGWRNIDILRSFHEQVSKGRSLSEKQLAVLPKFEGRSSFSGGSSYGRYRRYAADDPTDIETSSDTDSDSEAPPIPKGRFSQYDTAPVGEWFNIGKPITDEKGEKLGAKRALLAVDNFKNSDVSVEQARQEFGDTPIVAVYGAYEWLKRNDPVFGPGMDFTDQLQVALRILETDPKALAAEQGRYRALFIDEAQDLNVIQFRFFQAMGAKADLLSFIGDDKQAIYLFRGAKSQLYVDLSRQPDVTTLLMTTNFRSGKAIVEAANRLIAHNEDRQIPMICRSFEARGEGAIKAAGVATHEDGAQMVAQAIKDAVDAGESPQDFGILVRNNAESDSYTLSLIVRGIPYRMLKSGNGGYFDKPLVKALISWMRLIVGGTVEEMNDAVVEAHRTPGFGLDEMFAVHLGRSAKGSYLDYISSGGQVYVGNAAWLNKRVQEYVEAIRTVRLRGRGESGALVRAILDLKGPKGSFVDALVKLVDEDDVIEDENGAGGEDAVRTAAMAPVRPVMLMAEHFPDPTNMLAFVSKMKAANEKTQKKSPTDKEDWKVPAVLVGTTHGWKGLQAKHVYVCMAGGVFPNFRSDQTALDQQVAGEIVTAYDEERRLAYVAITRGQDTTTVVCPRTTYLGKPATTSMFVDEACIPGIAEAAPETDQGPDHPLSRQASENSSRTGFVTDLQAQMGGTESVSEGP